MHATKQEPTTAPKKPRRRHFLSYKRRWVVWGSLFLLIGLLIAYNVLTQDHRVRAFLERELSHIVGGGVTVRSASFSIFSGLQVEDVTVNVESATRDDSQLFNAQRLRVALDYSRLLKFELPEIDRVEAQHVKIQLCEDPPTSTWNFQRLVRHADQEPLAPESRRGARPPSVIPTVHIQDAMVIYQRRIGDHLETIGNVDINATIFPMSSSSYGFHVISEPSTGKEVSLVGSFNSDTDEIAGKLGELNIDHGLRELLPTYIRPIFEQYDFTGRFSVPMFRYRFSRGDEPEQFSLTLDYKDARLTVQPRQWLTRSELWRMGLVRETINTFGMLGMNQPIPHDKLLADSDADVIPTDLVSYLQVETRPVPLYLTEVTGQTTFTDQQVKISSECKLQGQQLVVEARLQGYSAQAAGVLSIRTKPGTNIQIPPSQQFMAWLPDDVRKAYLQFKPRGKGMVGVQLTRELPGGPFDPVVVVDLFDSQLEFDDFPYPLQHCAGSFIFSHDSASGQDLLRIQDLRGNGVPGGPNASSVVEINGTIGPFVKDGRSVAPGIDVRIKGTDISSEPKLRESFPKEVAKAMELFGPPDYGHRLAATGQRKLALPPAETIEWPHFSGDFDAHVSREPGPRKDVNTDVRLDLKKASGTLKVFPYPMQDLTCVVQIHDNFLELKNLQMQRNGASLKLDGKVSFTDPVNPDIQVDARNVALDDDLLDALPPTERSWVKRAGLGGRIDIGGRVFLKEGSTEDHSEVDFGLNIHAHDAKLLKDANGPAITDLNGDLFLQPARLQFSGIQGKRGNGSLLTSGALDWQDGTPDVEIKLNARDLLLDKALHDILPVAVQETWDQHRPEGTTDLDLNYVSRTAPEDPQTASPTTAPTDKIQLSLRPKKMSAMSDAFPYRLDDLQGEIVVDDKHVLLKDLTGHHGETTLRVDADGVTGSAMDFQLNVLATRVTPDQDLKAALPDAVADAIQGIGAAGQFTVRLDNLHVRNTPSPRRPAASRAVSQTRASTSPSRPMSTQPMDVDFNCVVTTQGNGSVDLGVPVTDIFGWAQLIGEVREDNLTKLNGTINADSYKLLGRSGSNLTAILRRPDYSEGLLLQSLRTQLAGGSVAGDVTIVSHGNAPSQYAVEAVVQDADLAQVLGPSSKMHGSMSASFAVEGVFGDSANRRGRGSLQIRGQNMYEAPIILGFFRLVNFSLPVRDGVKNVDVSYTLMRDQATFDSIQLSAPGLRIYGDGVLDFSRKEVNLTLNTENPDAWSVPLINKLVRRAREELLQIRIKGSLEEPKVQALTFPTFQTTLDKVVQDVKQSDR